MLNSKGRGILHFVGDMIREGYREKTDVLYDLFQQIFCHQNIDFLSDFVMLFCALLVAGDHYSQMMLPENDILLLSQQIKASLLLD